METTASTTYPLLPLRKTVILPGAEAKLNIGRARSLSAIDRAVESDHSLVVSTQHDGEDEDPLPEGLNRTGTLVRLLSWERYGDGTMQVTVAGVGRVRIERIEPCDRGYAATATLVEEPRVLSSVEALLRAQVIELCLRQAEAKGKSVEQVRLQLERCATPGEVADYLGDQFIADWRARQSFLDTLHPVDRLERLAVALGGEVELAELETRIRARVREQIDRSQREYYLREQLKVIYDELGGEVGGEIQALRDRIEAAGLPPEAREKALREVNRLERLPSTSPEGGVIRTYLDWILSLPWAYQTRDTYDIVATARMLDEDHYGLEKVKERLLEFLAVRELTERSGTQPRCPILCLVGPPGVGKTSLGQSIARSLGRRFVRISLGGVRDEAEVRGHRRTYVGALPGRVLHGLRSAGSSNPVMLLDEIDKMSSDYRGDPASAMLEVLDPEQNRAFVDHYLELPFDLSSVLFIATANSLDTVPRPLIDRMEVVHVGGYTEDEKVQIARRYLLPRQLRSHGLSGGQVEFSERMLRHVVRFYTREAGVRNLERQIGAVCRKGAHRFVSGRTTRIRVTPHLLEEYLGPPRRPSGQRARADQVGVATGMAWTELGGTLLPVEVATLPGKGALTITGRTGEVMQESAKAALSYARSRAAELGIPANFQETTDCHIHLPEGAVPKDGPSAGITMAAALISALTGRAVRADVAMTGEITLRGRVLAIGGLKEKVLAAHQAGIRHVIAPAENQPDAELIPRNVRRDLELHWVGSMDEVLSLALVPERERVGREVRLVDRPPHVFEVPAQAREE